VSYLPLLLPEIKQYLMDVVFDEIAAKELDEEHWWFENESGQACKW
jgi:autophagy-related protein 5